MVVVACGIVEVVQGRAEREDGTWNAWRSFFLWQTSRIGGECVFLEFPPLLCSFFLFSFFFFFFQNNALE